MDQPQMASQQPQANPLAPMTLPTVAQTMQAYRQHTQDLMSGLANQQTDQSISQNPWAPDEVSPSQLSKEQQDHSAWLETQPVTAQNKTSFDNEAHMNILRNLQNDPAFKKIDQPFTEVLDQLHGLVKNGTITHDEAMQHLMEAAPMMDEAIDGEHGAHSHTNSHSLVVDPDLHSKPALLTKGGK